MTDQTGHDTEAAARAADLRLQAAVDRHSGWHLEYDIALIRADRKRLLARIAELELVPRCGATTPSVFENAPPLGPCILNHGHAGMHQEAHAGIPPIPGAQWTERNDPLAVERAHNVELKRQYEHTLTMLGESNEHRAALKRRVAELESAAARKERLLVRLEQQRDEQSKRRGAAEKRAAELEGERDEARQVARQAATALTTSCRELDGEDDLWVLLAAWSDYSGDPLPDWLGTAGESATPQGGEASPA